MKEREAPLGKRLLSAVLHVWIVNDIFLMSVNHRRLVALISEEVAVNVPRVLIASACLLVVSWAHSVEVVHEVSYRS